MFDFMLIVAFFSFCVFVVLTIIALIQFLQKKPTKRLIQGIVASLVVGFLSFIGMFVSVGKEVIEEGITTTTEQVETSNVATTDEETIPPTTFDPTTEKETAPPTTKAVDTMVQQFISLGFTKDEAEEVKEIFTTVGITEINNIQAVGDAGIDNLQAFRCDIYDYHRDKGGPLLLFTVENRQLCYIALNGFVNTYTGKKESVVLYDIWNEDGTITEEAEGYKAIFNYEAKDFSKYEK